MGRLDLEQTRLRSVHTPRPHESAHKHVAGSAPYVDDLPQPEQLLHAYVGFSSFAHGKLTLLDLDAVRAYPGVLAVVTADDIPGPNDISPVQAGDECILAAGQVEFLGQPLFAVAAKSRDIARRACKLANIRYEELPAILDIDAALAADSYVLEPHTMCRGDSAAALADAPNRLNGEIRVGGQDHFYLEGQISMVLPQEDKDLLVHTSSQHPSEVQEAVAHALNRPANAITVEVRRMGGAFGGR